MGKMKKSPSYHVFTFRADDELAAQIREAVKGYDSKSQLFQEAVREKLLSDYDREYRQKVAALRGR